MDRHPDISNVLIHDRIIDLFATASSSRARRGDTISVWRKLAGATLVRLGEAILGEPRPATTVTLAVAGPGR